MSHEVQRIRASIDKLFGQSTDGLLTSLPHDKSTTSHHNSASDDLAWSLLSRTNLDQDRKRSQYETKIEHRSLLLHPATNTQDPRVIKAERVRRRREAKRRPRPLSAKEKRTLKSEVIPKEACLYSTYQPLHTLWSGYIREILLSGGAEATLLKADYHGAMLKVIKSSSPSMLFHEGIVVKESRHTFIICTVDDKIKTIPKRCTVFEFWVSMPEQQSTDSTMKWEVYGEHFGYRAAERVGKKFKGKHTIDF